jgi:hypothetical protein
MALGAGIPDGLAAATTGRARLLHGEDAALHAHVAATAAGAAGLDAAVGRARALAGVAGDQRGDLDALFDAGDGFFPVQFHHVADIGATACRACTAATEDIAEDVAEDVAHVRAAGTATAHAVLERGMAVRIIGAALGPVRQHLVGFLALLERRLGGGIAGIAVGMVLHRAAPISLLQVFFAGVAGHAQDFVVIALAHVSSGWSGMVAGWQNGRPWQATSPVRRIPWAGITSCRP